MLLLDKPSKVARRLRPEDFTAPLYLVVRDGSVELTVRVLLEKVKKVEFRILHAWEASTWAVFDRQNGGELIKDGPLMQISHSSLYVWEGDILRVELCEL